MATVGHRKLTGFGFHRCCRKSAAGPDLGKLFIGSEGTLGIITEGRGFQLMRVPRRLLLTLSLLATLKLHPLLPYSVGVSSFPSVQHAANAVAELVKSGVGLQCIELLDDIMMKAVNLAARGNPGQRQYAENPSLFLKFSGTEKHIEHDIKLTCPFPNTFLGQRCPHKSSELTCRWLGKQPRS
jgi:D-lactate dehydrogenase (cytochrome)